MVIHEDAAVVIDKKAPFDRVCLLGCALTTGFGAATRTADVQAASTAVLYGLGGIGSGVLNGLVQSGADMIIVVEPLDWKEEVARKMGATHFINPKKEDPVKKILELTNGVGADYAFECWGSPETQAQCYNSIRNRGKAIYIGAPNMAINELPVNVFSFCVTERIVQGSLYGSVVPKVDVPKFVQMFLHGKFDLDSVVTKTFKLEEINEAFRAMHDGEVVRGVIKFD
jgi:S-(hydroxymethyl)glutathione dehydrogenase/alcohol dehydrogenase